MKPREGVSSTVGGHWEADIPRSRRYSRSNFLAHGGTSLEPGV